MILKNQKKNILKNRTLYIYIIFFSRIANKLKDFQNIIDMSFHFHFRNMNF